LEASRSSPDDSVYDPAYSPTVDLQPLSPPKRQQQYKDSTNDGGYVAPTFSPTGPSYIPTSPSYNPTSPAYFPQDSEDGQGSSRYRRHQRSFTSKPAAEDDQLDTVQEDDPPQDDANAEEAQAARLIANANARLIADADADAMLIADADAQLDAPEAQLDSAVAQLDTAEGEGQSGECGEGAHKLRWIKLFNQIAVRFRTISPSSVLCKHASRSFVFMNIVSC
jgi:hypothetical protein